MKRHITVSARKDNKSGYYLYDYYLNGKRNRPSTGTKNKEEAIRMAKDKEIALIAEANGFINSATLTSPNNIPALPSQLTMGTLEELEVKRRSYLSGRWQDEAARRFKLIQSFFPPEMQITSITHESLLDYIKFRRDTQRRSGKYSDTSIQGELAVFKAAINYAIFKNRLTYTPFFKFRGNLKSKITKDEFFTEEEIRLIVSSLDWSNPLDRFIYLSAVTGQRLSTVYALTWGELERAAKLTISKTDQPSGIFISPDDTNRLKRYKPCTATLADKVFCIPSQHTGEPLTSNGLSQAVIRRIHSIIGDRFSNGNSKRLIGMGSHCFRRSLVTYLLDSGWSGKNVQAYLGWKTPRMVMEYSKASTAGMKEIAESLPWKSQPEG